MVSLVGFGILAFTIYAIGVAVYRLYLSPVAHVPGPFLAKVTYWYETWFDVILTGRYVFKVRELHEQYGPIVRINPHEVHINDADFYDVVYAGGSSNVRRDKWAWVTKSLGIDASAFSAVEHEVHRTRRAAINPFFSKAKVRSLQPRIEACIQNILGRMKEFQKSGSSMRMDHAFACLTNDIVTEYAFGRSYNRIEDKDFDPSYQRASLASALNSHATKHFPWLLSLLNHWLPTSVVVAMVPDLASHFHMQTDIQNHVKGVQDTHQVGEIKATPMSTTPTIIHEMLSNPKTPVTVKSFESLWQNGQVIILGGTVTTSSALTVILVHLLNSPSCLRTLREELASAIPSAEQTTSFDLITLERLPYLTAVIKEALRLGNGITARLPRIDPDSSTLFTDHSKHIGKRYIIPAGTPMSMTSMLIHLNPAIYTDPLTFNPSRWLGDNPPPEKYFHPFSKGSRACLGINLAYAEMYLVLAHLFRRYGSREVRMEGDLGVLELFETGVRDVEIVGDGLVPLHPPDSRGVRILVRE